MKRLDQRSLHPLVKHPENKDGLTPAGIETGLSAAKALRSGFSTKDSGKYVHQEHANGAKIQVL
jgi:hypothetical protein